MNDFFNRSDRKELRQKLRGNMPLAEVRLWSKLRNRQLAQTKFRRQFSIGPYILDPYAPEKRLAIEIDGDSHFTPEAQQADSERQAFIESFGIRVVRFTNADVMDNLEGVLERVKSSLTALQDSPR